MAVRLRRLICFLGFHQWFVGKVGPDGWRVCWQCGKVQCCVYDGQDTHWVEVQ